ELKADGELHRFYSQDGNNVEAVTKPGSHISEVKYTDGGLYGYELRDDQNHVTKIQKDVGKDSFTVTTGDRKVSYDKAEVQADGSLKLTNKDGTVEMKADGTTLSRDKDGKVTEIVNSDSEKTTFKKGPNGMEATVTNADGKVVEKG